MVRPPSRVVETLRRVSVAAERRRGETENDRRPDVFVWTAFLAQGDMDRTVFRAENNAGWSEAVGMRPVVL